MIELFSANTPNGKKISIMLEEIGYEYKVTKVDINNKEQFKEDFKKISPFSKIPVISKRIYKELDERLSKAQFLSGNDYTIADIGTFPWIARHEWHDIGLKKFSNLTRWYKEISERDAVKKGFAFMNENEIPPKP